MSSDNHIIPVSNGLFEHKERIGAAIWEFLWCIDRTTSEEIDGDGIRWGIILHGTPIKIERIAAEIKSSSRTVQRNMSHLKSEGYISTVRVSRGEIIKVRNNQKRSVKNGVSSTPSDTPKMAGHEERSAKNGVSVHSSEAPNVAYHNDRDAKNGVSEQSDMPNVAHLKDFKDLTTTTIKDPIIQLVEAYCELHKRLEFHVRHTEREIMGKMIAGGMPVPFIIQTMMSLWDAKKQREEEDDGVFQPPGSFKYYEPGIWEAWRNRRAPSHTAAREAKTEQPSKETNRTKQQKQIDELKKLIEEGE